MMWYASLVVLGATVGGLTPGKVEGPEASTIKIERRIRNPGIQPLTMARFSSIRTVQRNDTRRYRLSWLRVMVGKPGSQANSFCPCPYRCTKDFGPLHAEFTFASKIPGLVIKTTQELETRN